MAFFERNNSSAELDPTEAPVIAVTSGKGGVGKTNVVVNLALALARRQRRVTILDADLALGNVDVVLGVTPTHTIEHVLGGQASMSEALCSAPGGVRILPASSGGQGLTALNSSQERRLFEGLSELSAETDVLLIDTPAGISDNVLNMLGAANRVIVVTSPEPTAVLDAYAVIKLLATMDAHPSVQLLVNSAQDENEGERVHRQMAAASKRFLNCNLAYLGHVLHDTAVPLAVRARTPLLTAFPESDAARCFDRIAQRVISESSDGQKFDAFFRRLAGHDPVGV